MNARAQNSHPASAPQWLECELAANTTFVQEAIENDVALTKEMAAAWIDCTPVATPERIGQAVDAWIAHQWQFHDYDARLISHVWQSFDADAVLAGQEARA